MPFILTTGYHGTDESPEMSALGITDLLTKPVDTQRLALAVRSALAGRESPGKNHPR
jgi:DNA-binding NtrC family response regulator